jgi:hypothetical protein
VLRDVMVRAPKDDMTIFDKDPEDWRALQAMTGQLRMSRFIIFRFYTAR